MNYHEPHELLSQEDMDMHRILQSIIEEIEAVDWYYQRAAATDNPLVRKFVLHNAHEEIEHALIGIEYLRRTSPVWSDMIDEYLYQDGELMEEYNENGLEKEAEMTNKEKLVQLIKEGAVKSKSDQLTTKLKSKIDPRIFGEDKIDIKHRGLSGIRHYAGKDSLDVDSESFHNQKRKARIGTGLGAAGSIAGGAGIGKLVSKLTDSKAKGALAGLGAGAAGMIGTNKYNKKKLLDSLSESDRRGLQNILKHRNKVVANDLGQAQKARKRTFVGIPGVGGMYDSSPVKPKTASLEKLALNRAEKEYMKKFKKNNPDKVREILGEKSIELNNLKPGQQAKMNDYIRNKVKSDVNSANRAASMSKKKLPKGVKTEHKELFGKKIPFTGKKKTTYGTGSATNSYARDEQRARLQDALKKNERKQTLKSIATPGTAAGGIGGYLLSNKLVDNSKDHSKKKKALGTLGGAVAGNLIGKKLRG